jgi:hypothetical protein
MQVGVGNMEGKEGVPNMTSWRACDASTPLKLVGRVCVFDEVRAYTTRDLPKPPLGSALR